jgi:transposase
MRKTREILRLKFETALSQRAIARACGVSNATVWDALRRLEASGLSWPLPEGLGDAELEARLYRARGTRAPDPREPDWAKVHEELRRHKHVTLQLLWQEYREAHPDGYGYSYFCQHYRAFLGRIDVVMRQQHRPGEKLFVDWAGDTLPYVEAETGEVREAHLFLAVLGFSNFVFARAYPDERTESFLDAHVRAFEHFGGAPELVVPDNLKTGVKKPDRYEAEIYAPYAELAAHYGTVVLPARVGKPRDKAKVEVGVQIAEREILAPLRHRTFFSLSEANAAIAERLRAVNERPFAKLPGSRASVFAEREAPLLRPLPAEPYVCRTRKIATVHIDYHVELEGHYYSVPYHLVREKVELRFDARAVEVYHEGVRVAVHVRSRAKGRATTAEEHMPAKHRHVTSWTPERITAWAAKTGPGTAALCEAIMAARPHPELSFRSCLGVLRLGDRYTPERLEAACRRAHAMGATSYRSVCSILEHGLDQEPGGDTVTPPALTHANVRGADYYD